MRAWAWILLWTACSAATKAAELVDVQPAPERFLSAGPTFQLRFDEPMDPSSLDVHGLRVFGRWSGPASLDLGWSPDLRVLRAQPDEPFFAGELVTLRLARTLRSATGQALPHGYAFQYWVHSLGSTLQFEFASTVPIRDDPRVGVRAYGAHAADLDDDGDSDLAVPCEDSSDLRVFLNDGFGGYGDFTILPLLPGGGPSANDGADFDRDGMIDLILGNAFSDRAMLLRGLGDGSFDTRVDHPTGAYVRGVAAIDLNGDACEDVVATNSQSNQLAILIGDGLGQLTLSEPLMTSHGDPYGIAVGETNGDGLLDVFVGCNLGRRILLFHNDGEGGLVQVADVDAGGRAWSLASGDLDGDGDGDVVAANSYTHNLAVVQSDGGSGLQRTQLLPTGEFPLSIDLGDLDGDGDLDLMTSNLFGQSWTLYANDGTGNFVDRVDIPAQQAGSCALFHDRDGDGSLDFTGIDEVADLIFIFERAATPPPRPSMHIRLWHADANPFRDLLNLGFELSSAASPTISIYDARGRLLRREALPSAGAGEHSWTWDGRDGQGRDVGSGSYRVQIEAGSATAALQATKLR